jgi:6-phosphofructokinase 1
MAGKRIGILTGGGDVPGLNPCIKAVVDRAEENGWGVLGIRRGWGGLLNYDPDRSEESRREHVELLTRQSVRTIDRYGGTFLHSSRTNPGKVKPSGVPAFLQSEFGNTEEATVDCTPHVMRVLHSLGIDTLAAIGGDDTLSFATKLNELGVKIVAIPKTMDNDVRNTEYCIGFSTAITRASDAIQRQRTTIASHERIGIFRVFGRDAGFTALYTAYVTSIRCVIPEYPVNLDKLIQLLIEEKRANPSNYALVVMSEGARWQGYEVQEYGEPDAYGHRKKASVAESLADEIKRRTGEETITSDLTYDLRSGEPDFVDKLVGLTFGNMAYDAILDGRTALMTALVGGRYELVPIPDPKLGPRKVDVATAYNTERYRPMYANKLGMPVFLNRAS